MSEIIITQLEILLNFLLVFQIFIMSGCATDNNENGCYKELIADHGVHFDAIVDGNKWFPQDDNFMSPGPIQLTYELLHSGSVSYRYFDLSIVRDTCPNSGLVIHVDSMFGVGSYKLSDIFTNTWATFFRYDQNQTHRFHTDSLHTGVLVITQIDTNQKLIFGSVSFDAAENVSVITLRGGSFTFNY